MKNKNITLAIGAIAFTCFGIVIGFVLSSAVNKPAIPTTPTMDTIAIQNTAAAQAWLAITQTQLAMITPTLEVTATPSLTATPKPTFTPSAIPSATQPPLFDTKYNGFYLVNVDIAPGVWRSDGSGDNCYWAVTNASGSIMDNHFGLAGGTAYIPANAFQVQFEGCGLWTYIQAP